MKINKQLLEELILEVLEEEEAELDEVFGGVARTVNRALGRQPRMQKDRAIGADTSSLSGAGGISSRIGSQQTSAVLGTLRDILDKQPPNRRAQYLAQLMIDMGIKDEDVSLIRQYIQGKMDKARAKDKGDSVMRTRAQNNASGRSQSTRDKESSFAASAPPPVKRVAENKRRRTIRIRRKK